MARNLKVCSIKETLDLNYAKQSLISVHSSTLILLVSCIILFFSVFKYQKDSVLVVNKEDYENCITSNPISKFADGNTVFAFDHFGFFYFISGQPGHCKSGQRLIIRVMVQSEVEPPQNTTTPPPKPAEEGGGDHDDDDSFRFGPPGSIFSGSKMVVASSCFMTAVVAAFVILCWFV